MIKVNPSDDTRPLGHANRPTQAGVSNSYVWSNKWPSPVILSSWWNWFHAQNCNTWDWFQCGIESDILPFISDIRTPLTKRCMQALGIVSDYSMSQLCIKRRHFLCDTEHLGAYGKRWISSHEVHKLSGVQRILNWICRPWYGRFEFG